MFVKFENYINKSFFNIFENVDNDAPNRNIISKRCDDRLIRIKNRGNIFENVKLNLFHTFRDLGADTEILFNNIFLFYIHSRLIVSLSNILTPYKDNIYNLLSISYRNEN
jgi:hypothetical protein